MSDPRAYLESVRAREGQAATSAVRDALKTKREFIPERMAILIRGGMSREEARAQAEAEYESLNAPAVSGYGERQDRQPSGSSEGLGALIPQAPAPANVEPVGEFDVGDLGRAAFGRRIEVAEDIAQQSEDIMKSQAQINWDAVAEQLGTAEDEELDAIKAAFRKRSEENPSDAPGDVLSGVMEDLNALPDVLAGKGDVLRGEFERSDSILGTVLGTRITEGDELPDLNPVQMEYMNAQLKSRRLALRDKFIEDADRDAVRDQMAEEQRDPTGGPAPQISDAQVDQFIRARAERQALDEVPDFWWLDPEDKEQVMRDPSQFAKRGMFQKETYFGETVETVGGWTLRVPTMWGYNLGAGVLSSAGEAVTPSSWIAWANDIDLSEEKREKREEVNPALADYPGLFNVAENLGLGGEASQSSSILVEQDAISPAMGTALTAGGYILDFADPTIVLSGGAIGAARAASKAGSVSRAVYGVSRGAASAGLRGFAFGAIDEIPFVRRGFQWLEPGDPRIAFSVDIANGLSARDAAIDFVRAGGGLEDTKSFVSRSYPRNSYTEYVRGIDNLEGDDLVQALSKNVAPGLEDTINRIDNISDGLSDYARGGKLPQGVRPKELARTVGAVAKAEPDVQRILRGANPKGGETRMQAYLRVLDEADQLDKIKNKYILSEVTADIITKTKGSNIASYAAVTPNTWIKRSEINDLLSFVKDKTSIGKIAQDIAAGVSAGKIKILQLSDERGIRTVYDITDMADDARLALTSELDRVFQEAKDFQQISARGAGDAPGSVSMIKKEGGRIYITSSQFRTLMNATIDMAAEGKMLLDPGSAGVVRSRDIARLPQYQQKNYMLPVEVRDLTRSRFLNAIKGAVNRLDISNVTTQQATSIRQLRDRLSTMDRVVRRDIARFNADPEFKTLLGADPAKTYTNEEIVGFLTVKKPRTIKYDEDGLVIPAPSLHHSMKWTGNMLFAKMDIPSQLLAPITGRDFNLSSFYLSEEGLAALSDMSRKYAGAMTENPQDYLRLYNAFVNEWISTLTTTPDLLAGGVQLKELSQLVKGKVPSYLLTGSYYAAEAQRIRTKVMGSLMSTDTSALRGNIGNIFDADWLAKASEGLRGNGILNQYDNIEDAWDVMVRGLIQRKIMGESCDTLEDFAGFVNGEWKAIEDYQRSSAAFDARPQSRQGGANPFADPEAVAPTPPQSTVAGKIGKIDLDSLGDADLSNLAQIFNEANDTANTIMRKNGFKPETDQVSIEAELRRLRWAFSQEGAGPEASMMRLMMGEDAYSQIEEVVASNGMVNIQNWILDQMDKPVGQKAVGFFADAIRTMNEFRYGLLLGIRTRFYGVTLLTNPLVSFSTVGMLGMGSPVKTLRTMKAGEDARTGIDATAGATGALAGGIVGGAAGGPVGALAGAVGGALAGVGSVAAIRAGDAMLANTKGPGSVMWNKIAHTDAAGRTYTHGEIWESIIGGGGLRSGAGFTISQAMINDTMRILPEKGTLKGAASQFMTTMASTSRVADQMDIFFRLNTAFTLLGKGRSMDEAVQIARRSIYDYGDMKAWERTLSAYFMIFYSFTRQLTAQTMRSFTSYKQWTRMIKLLKFQRGIEGMSQEIMGYDKTSSLYMPDYTLPRPALDLKPGLKNDVYGMGPLLPHSEGIILLSNLLSVRGIPEEILNQLSPNIKVIINANELRMRTNQLSPENVVLLNTTNAWPMLEAYLGPISAVPGIPEDGAVGGYIYKLTPEQERKYKALLYTSNHFGSQTALRDWMRILAPDQIYPFSEMTTGQRVAFAGGAYTPVKTRRPPDQLVREIERSISDINRRIRQLEERDESTRVRAERDNRQ